VSGAQQPSSIAVGGGILYWVEFGKRVLHRLDLTTAHDKVVTTGNNNCEGAYGGLAADETYVYWASMRVCRDVHAGYKWEVAPGNLWGGVYNTLIAGLVVNNNKTFAINREDGWITSSDSSYYAYYQTDGDGLPTAITADANRVYWLYGRDQGSMTLFGHDASSLAGKAQPVATGLSSSEGLCQYKDYLYWTAAPSMIASTGTIQRVKKLGGAAEQLAKGQPNPAGIAVDESGVYWVNRNANGEVMHKPIEGGAVETLAADQNGAHAIALDANAIYWTNTDGGQVMMLSK
jgi:sugar lactone lactonase YvrE